MADNDPKQTPSWHSSRYWRKHPQKPIPRNGAEIAVRPMAGKGDFWTFVESPLFLAGVAAVIAVASIRVATADHHAIVLCRILGFIAWAFLAAAIYRIRTFRNKRISTQISIQLALPAALLVGWWYGPWQHYPTIVVRSVSPFYVQDGHGFMSVELQNQSDDHISSSVPDNRLRLIPFDSSASYSDYLAMEAKVSKEIFDDLDKSDLLKSGPKEGVGAINPWQVWVESPRSEGALITNEEMDKHQQGKLTAFIGGRMLYFDDNGCKYRTEYCGFISKGGWMLANCHDHVSNGVKLAIPCRVE